METEELLKKLTIHKSIIGLFVDRGEDVIIKRRGAMELEYYLTQAIEKLQETMKCQDDLK